DWPEVVLRRSIRILSCPVFLTGPHLPRSPDVISERTFDPKVEDNLGLRSVTPTGGPGPVSFFAPPWSRRWTGPIPTQRSNSSPGPVSARFSVRRSPPFQGKRTLDPGLNRLTEWSFWNPFGSVRRDPKLNSRRPGKRLGQTRRA